MTESVRFDEEFVEVLFDVPPAACRGNSRACVRWRLGVWRGGWGEGPGVCRARFGRLVVVAGSRWRWRVRGIVIAGVWGMVEVVGVGAG